MGRIRLLDAQTANMIAAGEVVERPQGVVKELVENAIDAGSTRIEINLENGGLTRLTVRDNGCGMDREDAAAAFKRHATSKIQRPGDLWSIRTLGFRGEALPSIASVSKVTMNTSDGEQGTRIVIEYGTVTAAAAYPCDQGTEITVEGLFYRTPARLKHLKSGSYENTLVQNTVHAFAMSHPEIAFICTSDGKEAFRTSGQGDLTEVLYKVWGREAAENLIEIDGKDYDYTLAGYAVRPQINRASRNYIHIFINGRMIRSYRLFNAVSEGYRTSLQEGRYPLVVLNVSMDPHLLDVNVHPSKWEVRISKENQLAELITQTLSSALHQTVSAPETKLQETPHYTKLRFDEDLPVVRPFIQAQEPAVPYTVHKPEGFPPMEAIGILHGRYGLCSVEQGLAVLDLTACRKRIHYEAILKNTETRQVPLLIPVSLQCGTDTVERIEELNAWAEAAGIRFEPFGSDTVLVRELPETMLGLEEEVFLRDLIDRFREEETGMRMSAETAAKAACDHMVLPALTREDLQRIADDLSHCEEPYFGIYREPTFTIIDEESLAKELKR